MENELIGVLSELTKHYFEDEQLGDLIWEKTKELDKVARSLREIVVNWESIEKSVSEELGNSESNNLTSEGSVLKEDELLKMAQIKRSLKEIREGLEEVVQRINCQISEFTSSNYFICHDEGLIILSLDEFGYKRITQASERLCKTSEFLGDLDFSPPKVQHDLLSSKYLPKLLFVASEKVEETARETRQAAHVFQLTSRDGRRLKEKLTRKATRNGTHSKP
jgi:hypothetical protein